MQTRNAPSVPHIPEETPALTLEECRSEFGDNDYKTTILRAVAAIENPGQDIDETDFIALYNVKPSSLIFSNNQRNINPTNNPETGARNPFMLDEQSCNLILSHKNTLKKEFIVLVRVAELYEQSLDKFRAFCQSTGQNYVEGSVAHALPFIEQNELENPARAHQWYMMLQDMTPHVLSASLARFLDKTEVSLDDIPALWPEKYQMRIAKELDTYAQIILFANLNRRIRTVLRPDQQGNANYPKSILSAWPYEGISTETAEFIANNADIFSDIETMRAGVSVPDLELDDAQLNGVTLFILKDDPKAFYKYLRNINAPPVVQIETIGGSKTCEDTENRLVKELGKGTALLLRLNEPDGNSILFAVKFEDVAVAVVMDSTDGRFPEKSSYFLFGRTKTDIETMNLFEKVRYEKVDLPTNMEPLVFAKNREMVHLTDGEWVNIKYLSLAKEARHQQT